MDRIRRFLLVMAIGSVALAACAPAPTPSPSPTVRPSPTPVPGPTFRAATEVRLLAINIDFDRATLDLPADKAFVIHFRNADVVGILHDVEIRLPGGTTVVARQEAIDGGTQVDYVYEALPAGDYVFICSLHPIPSMTGTLRVR